MLVRKEDGKVVHVDPAPRVARVPSNREVRTALRRIASLVRSRAPEELRTLENALASRL